MIKLKINGKSVEAEEGLNLLEVIDEVDMQLYGKRSIPRLCYHEGLSSYSSCRLCVVEVKKNDKSKIETSCNYKIVSGLDVETHTKRVVENRKTSVELLLAKAPDSEVIKDLAFKLGVEKVDRYEHRNYSHLEDCIDCGLCERVCDEVVGRSAISMAGRGVYKYVSTPYGEDCDDCIGCGICSYICPTGAISLEEKDGKRIIWGKEFDIIKEGKYKLTKEQLEHIKNIKEGKESPFRIDIKEDLCKNCEMCVADCPQLLFSVAKEFNKKSFNPALWDKDKLDDQVGKLACAGCKVCYDVCPESAIDIYTSKKNVRILKDE
ncbi:MAG: 4Fe-4S dicluster domain-containing protein [Nanoarchaeota archaeon]|nr:4Fe-4S dicluster domain-containing protein [Nanoarchaeota archaeon]